MLFNYAALEANGKRVKGQIDAGSEAQALDDLTKRGMTVLEILDGATQSVVVNASGSLSRGKIKREELVAFMRELATLVSSGVSLDEALQTLHAAKSTSPLEPTLLVLIKGIHAGEKFSSVLERAGLSLPSYAYALSAAGEATGNLGYALTRCADQMEFDERLRADAVSALVYPAILITVGFAAVLFIFSFVVPKFAKLLQGKKVDLPWLSEVVLSVGVFVNQNLSLVLASLAGAVFVLVLLFKSGALVSMLRNTPGLKRWFSSGDTARWTSTLAVLVQNKVPILGALELTAKAASFPEVARRIGFLQADVRNGVQLSASMENHRVLDASSLSMIKVGERSGELGTMLGYVANYWLERNRNMQKRLVSLIEPFSILFLGLVIGVVMVGVIMAITSLTQVKL